MQVSFACDLIFRTMNKFFQVTDFIVFALFTYCLILSSDLKEAIKSVEIGEQSFGYTGFIFFAHENLCRTLKK